MRRYIVSKNREILPEVTTSYQPKARGLADPKWHAKLESMSGKLRELKNKAATQVMPGTEIAAQQTGSPGQ